MLNTIEITMTRRGFDVRMGARTATFPQLQDAVRFAEQRLEHFARVRELSDRCE